MLSVLGKAFRNRKSGPSKPENAIAETQETPIAKTNVERLQRKSNSPTIHAEILDRSQTSNISLSSDFSNSKSASARDVVFIDGAISEIGKLLRELDPQAEVHLLDLQSDGVDQIESHLKGRKALLAIHLFCDGDEGVLNLGNAQLSINTITKIHAKQLSHIGESLSAGGDILIYGCEFCAGETGQAAAAQLSMITGAEVAATMGLFDDNQPSVEKRVEPVTVLFQTAPDLTVEVDIEQQDIEQQDIEQQDIDISYSLSPSGLLDISAENGVLHSADLVGGILKSAIDSSGASIKINNPGDSQTRAHILPCGAILTLFTNGAFIYEPEADAGDGEVLDCLVTTSNQSDVKLTASIHVTIENVEPSSRQVTDEDQTDKQTTSKNTKVSTSQLSISVPDTSAGPIAETSTMVDTPLIFLQRNRNAISVSGPENDVIKLTLSASSGGLCARPIKGAQVEGYNSANLTIRGSVKQINAALDGLRFLNARDESGPATLTATALSNKKQDEPAVTKTVEISVTSIKSDQNIKTTAVEVSQASIDECLTEIEIPSAPQEEQPSSDNSPEAPVVKPDGPIVVEFIAPIGVVTTFANADETMRLREGDLTVNTDGSFSFSLREGHKKSLSRVTCCIETYEADQVHSSEIILDLGLLPLQSGKLFTGNVFSLDEYTCAKPQVEESVLEQPSLDAQVEIADEIFEEVADESVQLKEDQSVNEAQPLSQTDDLDDKDAVALTEIMPDENKITATSPVVLAEQENSDRQPRFIFDETYRTSDTKSHVWDVEELSGHSLHFSFDCEGCQTAVTPVMKVDQLTVDTYKRQHILFLDVNSTFNPQTHGMVDTYRIEQVTGAPLPDGMREIRNGFISIENLAPSYNLDLKISALMQKGGVFFCLVNIDNESGTIRPLAINSTLDNSAKPEPKSQDSLSEFAAL